MKKAILFAVTMLSTAAVFAQEATEAAAVAGGNSNSGLVAIGAALAIGLAVFGGTSAQGKAAAAALEGIARNPAAAEKLQTPMILALALIESLVLFGFGIAFLILGKAA